MAAGSRQRVISAVAAVATLLLGPNIVGLVAVIFPRLLGRFWTWSPSTRLEVLLTVFVGVFVPVIVVYSYLTRRRGGPETVRDGLPAPASEARLLPPLELVLLQIGNATFLTFAAILAVIVLGLLSVALRAAITHPLLVAHGFTVSLSAAAAWMVVKLRPGVLRALSWRRLATVWMRWPRFAATAIAGFGVVGATRNLGFLKIEWSGGQLQATTLGTLYAAAVIGLLVGDLLVRAYRPGEADRESPRPLASFIPAVGLAWLTSLVIYALYLNGMLLTLQAHLSGA